MEWAAGSRNPFAISRSRACLLSVFRLFVAHLAPHPPTKSQRMASSSLPIVKGSVIGCFSGKVQLGRKSGGPLRSVRGRTRRLHTLTATAAAAQSFDESSHGGAARSYRAARQQFSCQQSDVAVPQALNSHALLGTHAKHPTGTPHRQPRQLALALDFCKCSGFVRGTRAERAGPAQTPERRSLFHC